MDENLPQSMSQELDGGCMSDQRKGELDAKNFPSSKNTCDSTSGILPVEMDSDIYNMNHKHRGMCLIFNNKEFEPQTRQLTRTGTDVDAFNLYGCFRDLDFSVTVHHNSSKPEILAALKQAASIDHSNNDCFVCVVLSHGDEGVIYGKDGKFCTDLIFEPFTSDACPTLAGKPKLFFVQACQGNELDSGTILRTSHDGRREVVKIPNQADFLVSYSTVPGFYSWRNTSKGSWFIQALCHVLKNHAKEKELLEMLTMVSRRVAYNFMSFTPDKPSMRGMKQVPCFTSRLTRKVYFPTK